MESHPENFSSFYSIENLGFDLQLIRQGYKQFKPFFRGSKCLELGPAIGYMTNLLVDDFEELTVVEGSATLLSQIPDYPNIIKHHSLFEEFRPNKTYDTIILNHVLEHISDPILVLKLIKGWLSPEGHLIIGVPNSKSFHRLAAVKMGLLKYESELNERDIELGHYRVYDFDSLRTHVNLGGFRIIGEGGIFLKFLSNKQIEAFLDEKIIEAYFELGDQFKVNSAEIFIVAAH